MTKDRDQIFDEPLLVQAILDNEPGQGIDLGYLEEIDTEVGETTVEALAELDGPIAENLVDIHVKYDTIYRTPFQIFIEMPEGDWEGVFGESPTGQLEDWKTVRDYHERELIVTYETNEEEPLSESLKRIVEKDGRHVVAIRCDYATELSTVGFLSHRQAQAYLLRTFGYKIERIGELMDISTGAASSHVNRGERKVERMNRGVRMVEHVDEQVPPLWGVLEERVGETYWDPSNEMHVRICAVSNMGGAFPVYLVQYEDGDELDVSPHRVRDWERTTEGDCDFPELVEFSFVTDEE